MAAADDQHGGVGGSPESRGGHLAPGAGTHGREELAGRLADLGERLHLIGAAVTEPEPVVTTEPEPVLVAYPYGWAKQYPDADRHTQTIDVALTALDCDSNRDFDTLTYESNNGRGPHSTTRLNPAGDGVRGVPDSGVPGDGAAERRHVPDMEVDGR